MSECKHGIEIDWCATCTPPAGEHDPGTVFVAQFDGECTGCLSSVFAGEKMTARDGDYLCTDCAPIPEPDDLGGPFSQRY